ncbi:MAG: hypothetical protein QOK15_1122 [Nocardioidaceae bacterium]|nr:hypothetical protein [Nocardioidaceae bacterium]
MSLQEHSLPGGSPLTIRPTGAGSPTSRSLGWLPERAVTIAAVVSMGTHLLFLSQRLGDDEGGYAMVARFWGQPGHYLYGPQWVDRPPVLILVFAIGDHLGPYGVRLMAGVLATVLVIAAGYAAGAVRGRQAAGWAAWTALAFSSSTLLQGEKLDGELVAATFVMVSMALLLHAGYVPAPTRRITWLAVGSGAAAVAAVFSKQNFLDGLVFAFVLWSMGRLQRRTSRAFAPDRRRAIARGYLAGAVTVSVLVLGWASIGGKLGALIYAMYGFRIDAAAVMAQWSFAAPMHRVHILVVIAVVSGLALLVALLGITQVWRLPRRGPVAYAVAAAFGVAVIGVLGGGSFWTHYLLALVPTTALAAGIVASDRLRSPRGLRTSAWWTRVLVVLSLLVMIARLPWAYLEVHGPETSYGIGRWIGASAAPDDTISILYTHADLIQASGLAPAYPYSWSLPIRTLDPHLELMVSTLNGPHPPTWFVRYDAAHLWGLDPGNRVQTALDNHYVEVADINGHTVWLHDGRSRQLAPLRRGQAVTPAGVAAGARGAGL